MLIYLATEEHSYAVQKKYYHVQYCLLRLHKRLIFFEKRFNGRFLLWDLAWFTGVEKQVKNSIS